MEPSAELDRTLHYADDVTAADVEAIEAFLAPRLAEQRDGHYGTASYKVAVALTAWCGTRRTPHGGSCSGWPRTISATAWTG